MSELAVESTYSTGRPAAGLSQVERVVDTYIAPSKTFTDILRDTSWWLPFLLMLIFSVATVQVVSQRVGFDRVAENRLHASPKQEERLNELPPDQRARQMAMSVKATKYISYAFPVVLLIFFVIYALILWGSFNFGLGAQTTFPQVFALVFYAALPYVVRSILTIIILYAGNNADAFDQANPVGTNLAYYLPDLAPWLKALLMRVDLFELWNLALITLGMSVIAKKTLAQAAVVVLGLWTLTTVITVAVTAFTA